MMSMCGHSPCDMVEQADGAQLLSSCYVLSPLYTHMEAHHEEDSWKQLLAGQHQTPSPSGERFTLLHPPGCQAVDDADDADDSTAHNQAQRQQWQQQQQLDGFICREG